MKKWNKPELLNLMLQETKTNLAASEEDSKILDSKHWCNKDGVEHKNLNVSGKDKCSHYGHNKVLNYKTTIWGRNDLISCCTAPTMS